MPIHWNEISEKSNGGTEQMGRWLESEFDGKMDDMFIVPSRLRTSLPDDKYRIFWAHDLPNDPESKLLDGGGWKKYHKIIFVSHWQKEMYQNQFKIPFSKCVVLQNCINPIGHIEKDYDQIKLIYHTTPHRGLNILFEVYDHLSKKYGDKIHLDVFSSFKIYGWEERDSDNEIAEILNKVKNHEHITYHGTQPNDVVREALSKAHIFAYPSIWPESSCLSLMEAMSASCMCVHSDYAALYETAANWTYMYPIHENHQKHAEIFYGCLDDAIKIQLSEELRQGWTSRLMSQKMYADLFYNKELRKVQWSQFFDAIRSMPIEIKDDNSNVFVYNT